MEKVSEFQVLDISLLNVNFTRNEKDENSKLEEEEFNLQAQLNCQSSYEEEQKILTTVLKISLGDEESPFIIKTEMGENSSLTKPQRKSIVKC